MVVNFYKKLGMRIRALREQAGYSQEKLADLLKISRVSLSQIETGDRRINAEEVAKLSKIFNVASDILLDLKKDIKVVLEKKTKPTKTKSEIRINIPQKNLEKFKEVLLYILNKVGSKPNIGESVLYKLLYFIDFNYYEKYEEQLIGATYIKNNYGPTPKEFIKIIEEMETQKEIVKVEGKYFQYPQRKYLPLRTPDLSRLKANELRIIDDVLEKVSNMNAARISEYSHNDVPWLTTDDGEIIDYESVFYRTSEYSMRSYSEEDI
ncbi:MAG: helix-turn-helix protein [Candidatus Scalindua rubra]|uniref:Helix-turn-helix protein n=1 Tax=Candidatus Scalindua rubra TaxID=1872076 RepID=A0A1E3X9Y5_9BACT|nr:MAG: helix-turn-helix protein [Candidatus Scalindua rubra]